MDEEARLENQTSHQSGGFLEGEIRKTHCPNCDHPLFPVFKLSLRDDKIQDLGIWDDEYLQILVCAACPLYLEPYWVRFANRVIEVTGGLRDKDSLQAFIEYPFESRSIVLEKTEQCVQAITPETQHLYLRRLIPPGVYHQIGGLPIFGHSEPLECSHCKKPMKFAGIVDYDDLNVPLFEIGHVPVALIIGDSARLYFYTCRQCFVVGFQFIPYIH
jgi:hypothetical protein